MSEKITIKEVIGDGFDFLKSSETHDDLKNQMMEAYSNSTEYIEKPIVVYEDLLRKHGGKTSEELKAEGN